MLLLPTNQYLPVSCLQIKSQEPHLPVEDIQVVISPAQWMCFLSGYLVQLSEIHTELLGPILFGHYHHGRCPETLGWADDALLKRLFDLPLLFLSEGRVLVLLQDTWMGGPVVWISYSVRLARPMSVSPCTNMSWNSCRNFINSAN